MSVELTLHWLPWTGVHGRSRVTGGAWRPATRLGSLKLHPAATPKSGIAVGSNGPVRCRWLARGSSSSCEWNTPPRATPPWRRDPSALESGGWNAVRRPMRFANMEAISVLNDENPDSRAASLNLPGETALGVDGTSGHTFPDLFPSPLLIPPWAPFKALLALPLLPCVQGEGHTVRAGTLLAAPSRQALVTLWVRI